MLNIAIAGLGTVGAGVVDLLQKNADLIATRAGKPIIIKAISARDKNKKRDCTLPNAEWVEDARSLCKMPGVDVVVELIGGANGIARDVAESALQNGKHLVTANKALLAMQGAALARTAESRKLQISFEAAVASGIPVIQTIRETLAGNHLSLVRGILNGTCNYILTRMEQAGLSFIDALREAQEQGYAEADPAADIDGHDTANKLAILAALAFGNEPDLTGVSIEGIRHLTPLDLQFARELGCRIKLLGVARMSESGLEQRVAPCLISLQSSLAQVNGALNAVLLRGDFIGDLTLEGQGAGGRATASAVVGDLISLARGHVRPAFSIPAAQLKKQSSAKPGTVQASRYYMRLQVKDKPGVVADMSAILRDEAISIESLLQRGKAKAGLVPVVLMTHTANPDAIQRAAVKIAQISTVTEKPCILRIED
ncbi:MAG: homoserine dehydrogenase [Alphaproteobacteria bacterium]|nr:homoserine dehydrogenase [Alphaproteobacteria bacterium]